VNKDKSCVPSNKGKEEALGGDHRGVVGAFKEEGKQIKGLEKGNWF